jgi:hypothetical protein
MAAVGRSRVLSASKFFASREDADHLAAGRDDIEIVDVATAFDLAT